MNPEKGSEKLGQGYELADSAFWSDAEVKRLLRAARFERTPRRVTPRWVRVLGTIHDVLLARDGGFALVLNRPFGEPGSVIVWLGPVFERRVPKDANFLRGLHVEVYGPGFTRDGYSLEIPIVALRQLRIVYPSELEDQRKRVRKYPFPPVDLKQWRRPPRRSRAR